jgi:hypothetical protein
MPRQIACQSMVPDAALPQIDVLPLAQRCSLY